VGQPVRFGSIKMFINLNKNIIRIGVTSTVHMNSEGPPS